MAITNKTYVDIKRDFHVSGPFMEGSNIAASMDGVVEQRQTKFAYSRTKSVDELRDVIEDLVFDTDKEKIVAITGGPGSGSSILAVEMLRCIDGAILFDCEHPTKGDAILPGSANIKISNLDISGCKVVVIDNSDMLMGLEDFSEFYSKCRDGGVVVVLIYGNQCPLNILAPSGVSYTPYQYTDRGWQADVAPIKKSRLEKLKSLLSTPVFGRSW